MCCYNVTKTEQKIYSTVVAASLMRAGERVVSFVVFVIEVLPVIILRNEIIK